MKHLFVLFSFLVLVSISSVLAQDRVEFYLSPGYSYRTIQLEANTDLGFKDSLNSMDGLRHNWSAGIRVVTKELGRSANKFQIGIEYRGVSFSRVLSDLQFHDSIHPKVGRINDLSVTVEKNAYFSHKYRYLSFPVNYQFRLLERKNTSNFNFYLNLGVAPELLIADDIKLFLKGFTVGGENHYSLTNDYDATQLNITAQLGGRMVYKMSEIQSFIIQPQLQFPIFTTAHDDKQSMRLYQLGLNVGVNMILK